MPNRVVREGILTSQRINALSLGAELFYRRVMSHVDDYGRCEADLSLLRAAVYPRRLNEVTEVHIKQWLQECTQGAHPLITIYYVGSETYLQINNFGQRMRCMKSRCPAPDSQDAVNGQTDDGHMTVNGQTGDSQMLPTRAESENESESEYESESKRNRTQALPAIVDAPAVEAEVLRATPTTHADFERWWGGWSQIRGTNHRRQAFIAWMSTVKQAHLPQVYACTQSYLASLENPAKGYNPENFLRDQAADGFHARWPPKRAGPQPFAEQRKQAANREFQRMVEEDLTRARRKIQSA